VNHTESFDKRNSFDIAENKCKKFLDQKGITWTQFGFDCRGVVSGKDFIKLNSKLSSMPDFMLFLNQPVMMECKGFYDILKLKVDDIKAYDWWTQFHPLSFFLYSTKDKRHFLVSYKRLRAIAVKCETDRYHDNNKEYHKIYLDMVRVLDF
tara:strand:- start:43 stop:495 length:453 start_codon:yes stop_codon:yes gene_type:complete